MKKLLICFFIFGTLAVSVSAQTEGEVRFDNFIQEKSFSTYIQLFQIIGIDTNCISSVTVEEKTKLSQYALYPGKALAIALELMQRNKYRLSKDTLNMIITINGAIYFEWNNHGNWIVSYARNTRTDPSAQIPLRIFYLE